MKQNLLLLIVFVLVVNHVAAQKDYFVESVRIISIDNYDGEEKFEIYSKSKKISTKHDLEYWWYRKGRIVKTIGAYSDYLLNGEYVKYNSDANNLLEKGRFKNGLKHGTWIVWSDSSQLVSITSWKNGKKNGKETVYSELNNSVIESHFQNNYLNGSQITIKADTIFCKVNYKHGVIVEKKNLRSFFTNIFGKKDKTKKTKRKNNVTENNEEATKE